MGGFLPFSFLILNCISALAQANANPPERLTYQGFLADGNGVALATNAPKNYDVVFRIWDGQTGGTNAWTEQQTVTVDKGFFSVLLGEGAQVTSPATEPHGALSTLFTNATASDRYVEMTVKGIGAAGADVKILPRLRLLTAPYAYLATKAISANSVDGGAVTSGTVPDARLSGNVALRAGGNTFSGNQIFNNNATVNGQLSVVKDVIGFQHISNDGSVKLGSVLYSGSQEAYFGTFTSHPLYLIANNGSVAVAALLPNGNFGIGTTTPAVKLDVNGVASVGPRAAGHFEINGNQIQYYNGAAFSDMYLNLNGGKVKVGAKDVVVGEENLRIVRGSVNINGVIEQGSGYTSQSLGGGFYKITFASPFGSIPTVTVSGRTSRAISLSVDPVTTTDFTVSFHIAQTGDQLSAFGFIAIGPR